MSCKTRGGSKGRIDIESLEEFVINNPDQTLSTTGIKFGIKASSVYRRLKALNFSYKKNLHLRENKPAKARQIPGNHKRHTERKPCIY